MSHPVSYKINSPSVTYDVFDQEVVLINLQKGFYYSLDQLAAIVWQLIEQKQTRDGIIQEILSRYEGNREEIEKSVASFLLTLEQEEIIFPVNAENCPSLEPTTHQESHLPKQPFLPPALQKHSDLQDLLLLDPIHEVNEAGWPVFQNNHSNQ